MPYNPGIQSQMGQNIGAGLGTMMGNAAQYAEAQSNPLAQLVSNALKKQKAGLPLNELETSALSGLRQPGGLERAASLGLGGAGFQRGMAAYGAVRDGMAASKAAGGSGSVWQGLKSL